MDDAVLDLFDHWTLEALGEGDLVAIALAAVLAVGFVAGVFSWLKGRKLGAVAVWLLLAPAVSLLFYDLSDWETSVGTDPEALSWGIAGAALAGLVGGVFSAIRLAQTSSWWAQRVYSNDKYSEAVERYGWTRIKAR